MERKWKIIFTVLILVGAVGFMFTQNLGDIEVDVMKASPSDIKDSFTEDGIVEAGDDRNVISLSSSEVEELYVEDGDRVEAGELLAVLDDHELVYSIQELRAQLRALDAEWETMTQEPGEAELEDIELGIEYAKDSLEMAKTNLNRIESLYEAGWATEVERERAEDMVREAEYNLEKQENAVDLLDASYDPPEGAYQLISAQKSALHSQIEFLERQQENYQIYAPISGVVTDLQIEEGAVTSPETPMMTIMNDENYQIISQVLTRDIYYISEGMEVTLTQKRRDENIKFAGEIVNIAPYAKTTVSALGLEEERVEVTIISKNSTDQQLAPGYQLEVEYTIEEQQGQLTVPKTAVFTHKGQDALFVVEENTAQLVHITTGLETNREVVVTEGLSPNDIVILDPDKQGLQDGSSVSYTAPE